LESGGMKFGRKACYFFHSGVLLFWRNHRILELRPECSAEFTGMECDGIRLFVWHILFVYFTPVAKQTQHSSLPPSTILFAAPSIRHRLPSRARTMTTHNDPPHTNELKHGENHPQTTNPNPTTPMPCLSTAASTHHATTLPTTTTSAHTHPRTDKDPPPAKHAHTPLTAMGVHNDGPAPPPTNDDRPLPHHCLSLPPSIPPSFLPPSFLPASFLPLPSSLLPSSPLPSSLPAPSSSPFRSPSLPSFLLPSFLPLYLKYKIVIYVVFSNLCMYYLVIYIYLNIFEF
ncbi:hypothetical protein K443DRAFT_90369, partial [Laccaria amethystina LaAM-08-1]